MYAYRKLRAGVWSRSTRWHALVRSRVEHDERLDDLAADLVRAPDDGSLGHGA
ncbi:hypothetical protein PV725_37680 [Streptomyces scabiei]|nr:hypothetical protein [Streptomyces scabiei]MDX3523631.1 hypothetical protein [Streptomyces scabiei]